jgi:Rrf2 family protein
VKLTKTLMYALLCLRYLSKRSGEYADVAEITSEQDIPPAYCQKVLFTLAKQGWVESCKGKGFRLARPLDALNLDELSQAFRLSPLGDEIMLHAEEAMIFKNFKCRLSEIKIGDLIN